MITNYLIVAGNIVTLFLMMLVGFFLKRSGKLGDETLSQITYLLLFIVTPCVEIQAFQIERTAENARYMLYVTAVILGLFTLYALITRPLCRKQPPERRSVSLYGVQFSNLTFMGIPLISSVLGQDAVVYCILCAAVFQLFCWTYGVKLMGQQMSLRKAVLNPGVMGMLAAVALFAFNVSLPSPVMAAVSSMSALNTPLAMVVIGAQMAASDLKKAVKEPSLYLLSAVKLLALPAVTILLLRVLPLTLDRQTCLSLSILAGCPVAGITSMFAQMYGRDTGYAAHLVTLSTLLSLLTLPVIASLAQMVWH